MIKTTTAKPNPDAIEQSLKQTAAQALEQAAASESQSGKTAAMARFMETMDGKLSSVLREPEERKHSSKDAKMRSGVK